MGHFTFWISLSLRVRPKTETKLLNFGLSPEMRSTNHRSSSLLTSSATHRWFLRISAISSWASHNNLTLKGLNCAKTREIIFQDKRSKRVATPLPPPLPGITRSTELKILGVTVIIIIIIIGFSVYLHNSPGDITQFNNKSMQKTEKFWAVV